MERTNRHRLLQALAVAGLLGAIALVLAAIHATLRAGEILGPGALVRTASGEVWLQVDRELWRLDAQGHRMQTLPVLALGLPGPPSHLVRHPSGAVVATVRDEPALYRLDASSARVAGTIAPQWPDDPARHASRAIDVAFASDGRVAIATGGGHAVAL